jgi:N-acetylglucosaminyldiphosphoundecaprenol N-acetyl-beta-D-mannosaminyltransferase
MGSVRVDEAFRSPLPSGSVAARINVLGVHVTAFNLEQAVAEMACAVSARGRAYACTCPVYTLMQGRERSEVRAALNGADWVTADGMPVVWALQNLGALRAGRVYGPDLMLAMSEVCARRGWTQFYLGGAPGVAELLARTMPVRFPGLAVAGTAAPIVADDCGGPDGSTVDAINRSGADVVWVGLGSPKQDLWMARHRAQLNAPLLVGVGAAFDFLTGRKRQAPGWAQRAGMEWLFRLASEPRRLWRRYAIYNPKFVAELALQLSGLRRYR